MDPLQDFELDHKNGLPVWIQLRNRIAHLIGKGTYREGDRLPTVRALAVNLDISYNTVNRAYMDLEREGYISTRKGRGTFVASRADDQADQAARETLALVVDDMIRACVNAGLDEKDISHLVQERLAAFSRA